MLYWWGNHKSFQGVLGLPKLGKLFSYPTATTMTDCNLNLRQQDIIAFVKFRLEFIQCPTTDGK